MARRPDRHRVLVVPLPLPSAGEQRATGLAVEREEAKAEPAVPVPRPRPTRSCRVAAAAIPLPDAIVVWEIFLRLPSKAILCCRAVCRSWRVLTSDHDFLLAHHRRQPSLPLVTLYTTESGLPMPAAVAKGSPPVLGFDDYIGWKLHASCDGLLLLSHSDGRFSICNPATRQCGPLPGLTGAGRINIAVTALYPHRSSGDYRVLYWKRHSDAAYHILNLGQGRSSRCIGVPAVSADMEKVMRKKNGMISISWNPPIPLHNRLHWDHVHDHDAAYVVVFDIVTELFRLMPGPAAAITTSRCTSLHHMDGLLGLSCVDEKGEAVKIWSLEDYESGVWSFKYQIELPLRRIPNIVDTQHEVLFHQGTVLVCHYSAYDSYMFHCDSNGKLLEEFSWGSWSSSITGHWFKQSLVNHAFFPRRSGDCVTQPHFFQRL
ncbi:unnamed protein product [Alopecurus aequalis]